MLRYARLSALVVLFVGLTSWCATDAQAEKLKALIIDGQNNHSAWPKTTVMMKQYFCLLYTSPSPRDATLSRMPSSA